MRRTASSQNVSSTSSATSGGSTERSALTLGASPGERIAQRVRFPGERRFRAEGHRTLARKRKGAIFHDPRGPRREDDRAPREIRGLVYGMGDEQYGEPVL